MTGYPGVLQEVRAVSGSAVLVAVSKTHPYEDVMEAYAEGARIFGENRVQEAEAKFPPMGERPEGMRLYLIGQLQRNKVRKALQIADRIESVDSLPLIDKIEKEAAALGRTIEVLLELNSSGEEQKAGFRTEEEWEAGSPLEKATLDYFLENAGSENGPIKGGLAIYASGNEYAPSAGFPGAYEKCISVAAVAGDFTPSTFTNYGPGTNISAPGGDQDYYYDFLEADEDAQRGAVGCILSTVPDHVSASGYGYMEGTSMACPHVSGVAALGLSYAAKIHKHFTAEEFKELLYESCQFLTDDPEDESNSTILRGNKFYYKWQVDASELIHARLLPLTSYRTKMGAGVINAANLISLIDNSGTDMVFPNLYIRTGSKLTADPSVYLDGSTFTVTISDPSVALVGKAGAEGDFAASASIDLSAGEVFTFSGLKSGYTTAEITSSEGTQNFIITVNTGSSSDWL